MNEENIVPATLAEETPVSASIKEESAVQLPEAQAEPALEEVLTSPLLEPETAAEVCEEPAVQPVAVAEVREEPAVQAEPVTQEHEEPAVQPQNVQVHPGYIPSRPQSAPYTPPVYSYPQSYQTSQQQPVYQTHQQQPVYQPIQQPVYQPPRQVAHPTSGQMPSQHGQYAYPPRQQFDLHYGVPPQAQPAPQKTARKKHTWLRISVAVLLAIAVVALAVWGIIAGATALIRNFAGDKNDNGSSQYSFGYHSSAYGENDIIFPGGTEYGEQMIIVNDNSDIVVENGTIYDSQGNVIGIMSDDNGDGLGVTGIPQGPLSTQPEAEWPGYYSDTVYYVCAEGGLNMRSAPSTQGQLILNIPNGTPLIPSTWENGWAYVEYQDRVGWVSADYLSTTAPSQRERFYVHAEGGLNMRSTPSTTGKRVANIPDGTAVYVLSWQNNWAYLEWNGYSGWCRGDYLYREDYSDYTDSSANHGYTQAEIDRAISSAQAYYRTRMGKNPGQGYTGTSLTTEEVEALYWQAVFLTVVEYYPAGSFSNHGDCLTIDGAPSIYMEVWDEDIRTMEDWANMFYCALSDEQAYSLLCQNCLFELDGKLYITSGAMGDEGLETHYTIDIRQDASGYALTMDVLNIRYEYGVREEIKWSSTFHCFKEDGVWVFDGAATPYK